MSRPPGSSGIPYPGGSSLRERFNWSLGPRCFIPMRPRLAWIIDVLFMSWNLKKSMVFFFASNPEDYDRRTGCKSMGDTVSAPRRVKLTDVEWSQNRFI
jgi:hypothetical protein